jgi:prevent-host-death family protein
MIVPPTDGLDLANTLAKSLLVSTTLKPKPAKPLGRAIRRLRRKPVAAATPARSMVNVHEAKTQLSRLLARVEAGEEITIARAGYPLARLVALAASVPHGPRVPGRFKGMFGPLTEEEAMAPLPPELTGLLPNPTDPLQHP